MVGLLKHHWANGLSFRRNRTSALSPPRPSPTSYFLFPPPKGAELLMGDPFHEKPCTEGNVGVDEVGREQSDKSVREGKQMDLGF